MQRKEMANKTKKERLKELIEKKAQRAYGKSETPNAKKKRKIRKVKKITQTNEIKKSKTEAEEKQKEVDRKFSLIKEPPSAFETSGKEMISLKQAKHHFRKKIAHLDDKEKKIADIHYGKYRKYLGKIGALRRSDFKHKMIRLKKYEPEIVELYGKMFTPDEVQTILKDIYGLSIPIEALDKVRNNNIELVAAKIEQHQKSHSDLRLSHKKSRLEEYTILYRKLKEEYLQAPNPPTMNSLMACLRHIKDEVEGDLVINGALNINLEGQINAHFKTEVYKSANIQELIIAKVASKAQVNPLMLLWSVENSYYHELNAQEPEDVDWEDVTYPSDEAYDYDKMQANHKKQKKKRENAAKVVANTEVTPEMAQSFREKLKSKLSDTKKVVKNKKQILAAIKKAKDLN